MQRAPRGSHARSFTFSLALATFLGACGSGDGGTTDTTMPSGPTSVSAVGGQDQSAEVGQPLPEMLEVRVTDADGQAVAGTSVTWTVASGGGSVSPASSTTGADGVAATTWTLGATAGSQSVQASVTGLQSVTFTATANQPPPQPFTPGRDTMVSGTMAATDVTVPDGVTVTLGGDADITASGTVSIAGTITGDCTTASLHGQGDVTISGTVTTECSTPPASDADVPTLSILSDGLLTLDGATITSGGDLTVGNPSALPAGSSGAATRVVDGAEGSAQMSAQNATCVSVGSPTLVAASGSQDPTPGKPGVRGGDVTLACTGTPDVSGISLQAGSGGTGASQDVTGGDATAVAQPGGKGGNVQLVATGGSFQVGATLNLTVGDGGLGGNATSKSEDPTVKAMATGGKGGDAGTLTVSAPFAGGATVNVAMGFGGLGGFGRADAANGVSDHPDGGDAEGHGGAGGAAPAVKPDVFSSSSAVVMITPPKGGFGGFGAAEFGSGRDGDVATPDGGNAGALSAFGGAGGSVSDADGVPGDGGELDLVLNHGGNGFDGCPTFAAGGKGGQGGAMAGSPGVGGLTTGDQAGGSGDIIYGQVGVGGDGGHGAGPGAGGAAGTSNVLELGNVIGRASSFQPGKDGGPCQTATGVSLSVVSDPNGHDPYTQYSSITEVTLEPGAGGAITLTSTSGTWVPLTGTLSGDSFTASGTGTVAGYPNIPVSITGTLTRDGNGKVTGFSGTVTIDGSNLPANSSNQHNDVVYQISGTVNGG